MMSGDINEMVDQMTKLAKDGAIAQAFDKIASAYDHFAATALQSLIGNASDVTTSQYAQRISEAAWTIADAMMVERKKRGLGGL